ncbi:MAG TPA: YeaH/YhbH family protein [Stellaceae bacterium]|nr:YeaH/YhbH family protein [Stellaceae bacterium]
MNIVDRRPNPKGKSLGNRRRFIERARSEVKGAVLEALRKRKVTDVANGEKVSIPTGGITEPSFRSSSKGGRRHHVVPGNKEHIVGDEIQRPPPGGGGRGTDPADDGEGEDGFEFTLSREEFLDMFFEDLELPDLVKKKLSEASTPELSRAGYTATGNPANLNLVRTMRNSMARRISLGRPKHADVEALELEVEELRLNGPEVAFLAAKARLDALSRRVRAIPYFDPIDVRYNRFERVPKPHIQAVMFCLMDVSGSMTERMKDLAKRFFMLLHIFLARRYKTVDIVFIRHTSTAQEVDEETFFYSRETGGTVVSTALAEMRRIIRERYPLDAWNIYSAQASDGDNFGADSGRCIQLLDQEILPICQHFAYIEVGENTDALSDRRLERSDLWRSYSEVADRHPNFAMRRVGDPSHIFPVFHDLFARGRAES